MMKKKLKLQKIQIEWIFFRSIDFFAAAVFGLIL